MKLVKIIHFGRLAVVAALLLALTATAWGHRDLPATMPAELAAYVAAGGDLDDLCEVADDHAHQGHGGCDACRLVDGAALPLALQSCNGAWSVVASLTGPAVASSPVLDVADPVRLARAPPAA